LFLLPTPVSVFAHPWPLAFLDTLAISTRFLAIVEFAYHLYYSPQAPWRADTALRF
jgi:hypothetical protein